jgi:hypothetical protein
LGFFTWDRTLNAAHLPTNSAYQSDWFPLFRA